MELLLIKAIEEMIHRAPFITILFLGSPPVALLLGWQYWLERKERRKDREEYQKQVQILSKRLEQIAQTLLLIAERIK